MKRKNFVLGCLCLTVFSTASIYTSAQTTGANRNRENNTNNAPGALSDTGFIRKNIHDNQMEIQMGQMAVNKATDQSVRTLAQQIVTDHRLVLTNLVTVARSKNMQGVSESDMQGLMVDPAEGMQGNQRDSGNSMNRNNDSSRSAMDTAQRNRSNQNNNLDSGRNSNQQNNNQQNNNQRTDTSTAGNHQGHSTMGDSTARNRGNMMGGRGGMQDMSALQNATGQEFDRMWVRQMLQMHEAKVRELTAATKSLKDPQLKSIATQALPKVKAHRDQLAKLNSQNGNQNRTTSRTERQNGNE